MSDKSSHLTDAQLEDIFASARMSDPVPNDDFMSRMFADIDASVPVAEPVEQDTPARSWLASIWTALGGWAGAGGLAAVAATGVWIGVASPASMASVSTMFWGDDYSVAVIAPADVLGLES